ncbi:MAG: hypothetical protein ACLFVX_10030 [Archaeoglobaceae archaeon]
MNRKLTFLTIFTAGFLCLSLTAPVQSVQAEDNDADLYPVAGHRAEVFDDNIWVVGGSEDIDDSSLYYDKVAYSRRGYNWDIMDNIPYSPRMYPGLEAYDGDLYMFGGGVQDDGTLTDVYSDVWKMNENHDWTEVTSSAPWPDRYGMGTVVYEDNMWLMGGNDGSQDRGDVWTTDNGENWSQVTEDAPWENRRLFGAEVFKGKIWVFSGGSPSDAYLDAWYSNDGKNWTNSIEDVTDQGILGAVYLQHKDRIWVISGSDEEEGGPTDKVEFTWGDDNYSYYEDYHHAEFEPRQWADGVTKDGRMFVIGGRLKEASWATTGEVWGSRDGKAWWNITAGEQAPVETTPRDEPTKEPHEVFMAFVGIGFGLIAMGLGYGISKGTSPLLAIIFLNIGLLGAHIFEMVSIEVIIAGFVGLLLMLVRRAS